MPRVSAFGLDGDACRHDFTVPAHSLHETRFTMDTPTFTAAFGMKLDDGAGLIHGDIEDGKLAISSEGPNNGILEGVHVDYQRRAPPETIAAVGCLTFGAGTVQTLNVSASRLRAELNAEFGMDAERRPHLRVAGPGAQALSALILRDAPDENATSSEPAPETRGLDVRVDLPVVGELKVDCGDVGATRPAPFETPPDNYLVIGAGGPWKGGSLRLNGFSDAGFVIDRRPSPTTIATVTKAWYHTSGAGAPVAVMLIGEDNARMQADVAHLANTEVEVTTTEHRFSGDMAAVLKYTGAPTTVRIRHNQTNIALMDLTLGVPAQVDNLAIDVSHDQNDDMLIRFDATMSDGSDISLRRTDESGAVLALEIDKLPDMVYNGRVHVTTCGVNADIVLHRPIERFTFRHEPTLSEGQPGSDRTPGCPIPAAGADPEPPTLVDAKLEGIPAGELSIKATMGRMAGDVELGYVATPIRKMELLSERSAREASVVKIIAENVTLRRVSWDMDGHTNYPGAPKSIFADSDRREMGRLQLYKTGDKAVSLDTRGRVYFDDFLFKLPGKRPGDFPLDLHAAGCMKLLDDDLYLNLSAFWKNALWHTYKVGKRTDWRCW